MFKFKHSKYSDKKLNESILDILENNTLLSLATVRPDGKPYINTAYYAFDNKLRLYIITDPKSNHSKNLEKNKSASVSIFNSKLRFWKDDMQGLQLFGKCYKTTLMQLPKGTSCFLKRFPVFKELVKSPKDFVKKAVSVKLYTIEISHIKLFDETRFEEEEFINLKI